jgi:tetratricopeptide (TPR) repeat protein
MSRLLTSNQARLRHAEHYEQLLRHTNDLYIQGGNAMLRALQEFDLEKENIHSAQQWVAEMSEQDDVLSELCSSYPDAGIYVLNLRLPPLVRIHWLKPAIEAAHRLKLQDAEGWHTVNLALAYAALGKTEEAIALYKERLAVVRETSDRMGEGRVLGNLANLYADIGDTQKAIELYHERLTIARKIQDQRGEASALANLGDAYADCGETVQAIRFHEQALHLFRELKERRSEGMTLVNLARAHCNSGDAARAIDLVEQSLRICREVGDRRCEGAAFAVLGDAFFDSGELQSASGCYEFWENIARELEDPRAEANALWRIALSFKVIGDDRAAMEKATRALTLFREIQDDTAVTIEEELVLWSSSETEN